MSTEPTLATGAGRTLDRDGLVEWLNDAVGIAVDRTRLAASRFAGGNSNETYLLTDGASSWVIRRPPEHSLDPSAHSMEREWRILSALGPTAAPTPTVLGYCRESDVIGAEFILMEYIPHSTAILDVLPEPYELPSSLIAIGNGVVDTLATMASVDWKAAGLEGFGRPDAFLQRQVPRWESQYRRNQVRDIPAFERLATWLAENLPPEQPPGIMHGDFHLDNCLLSVHRPEVLAVVDWEMATIGDPLVDLGLFLDFWSDRPCNPPAMARVQAVSRLGGAPSRELLIERYARRSGRDVSAIRWYEAFAFWKLAVVIESAWGQHVRGELDTEYSAALEYDVPCMFAEAEVRAGITEVPDLGEYRKQ